MNLVAKIESIELRIVALGKALSEATGELEKVKVMASEPTSRAKRNLKAKRVNDIEKYYTGLQLKKLSRKKR